MVNQQGKYTNSIGDEILPSYIWIIISQKNGSYEPISVMESQNGFARRSNVARWEKGRIEDNCTWVANGETSEFRRIFAHRVRFLSGNIQFELPKRLHDKISV